MLSKAKRGSVDAEHRANTFAEHRKADEFEFGSLLGRPGNDLLSRVLRRSTIGAGAFHGRVRNGIGCSHPAIITRSAEK